MADSRGIATPAPAFGPMADDLPVMIWTCDAGGQRTWFNRSWLSFVGRAQERELEWGWVEGIHADDSERCLLLYRAAVDAGQPFKLTYRLRRSDGAYRQVLESGIPRHDEAGHFCGLNGSCTDITELPRIEDDVQAGEPRYRLLSESAPVMIWVSDASGKCLHLNRRLREFWGVSNEQLADFDWSETMHPEDAARVGVVVSDAMSRRHRYTIDARFRNHSGVYRVLRTDADPQFDADGVFLGFIGVNIDITEEVVATRALQHSEERFTRFMTHLPGLAWIKDAAGRYIFVNQAAAQAFGRPADDLLGLRDDEIFPPDIAAQFKVNDARARSSAGGVRVIETLPQADGLIHHSIVSKFAIPDTESGETLTGGVAIDVSEHSAAEERIRRLNKDLRHQLEERETLLAALPVGVFIAHDAACSDITVNSAGATMFRLPQSGLASKSSIGGKRLTFRPMKDGRQIDIDELPMHRSARNGMPVLGEENEIQFADGTTITTLGSATPLFDAEGRVRGCVGVFVDLTERKRAEQQKGLLIDELNHRAKNTLAIVQSIASQTLRQSPDPQVFAAAFGARLDALARAHSLLTRTAWEGAPLPELVDAALGPFMPDNQRVTVSGSPVVIRAALAVTFCLLVHELATNAVKHGALSTAGGRLEISWQPETETVAFVWKETCGFQISAPTREGFGSRLIRASAAQLGGSVDLAYEPGGLHARFSFPN